MDSKSYQTMLRDAAEITGVLQDQDNAQMTLLILCELIQDLLGDGLLNAAEIVIKKLYGAAELEPPDDAEPWDEASLSLFVSMLLECWETHHTEHDPVRTEGSEI